MTSGLTIEELERLTSPEALIVTDDLHYRLAKQLLVTMQREKQLLQALHDIGGYVMRVMQDDVGPRGATIRGGEILEIVNEALHYRSEYSNHTKDQPE